MVYTVCVYGLSQKLRNESSRNTEFNMWNVEFYRHTCIYTELVSDCDIRFFDTPLIDDFLRPSQNPKKLFKFKFTFILHYNFRNIYAYSRPLATNLIPHIIYEIECFYECITPPVNFPYHFIGNYHSPDAFVLNGTLS